MTFNPSGAKMKKNTQTQFGVVTGKRFEPINDATLVGGAVYVPGNTTAGKYRKSNGSIADCGKDSSTLVELLSAKELQVALRKGKVKMIDGVPHCEIEDITWVKPVKVKGPRQTKELHLDPDADGCCYDETVPGSAERIAALSAHYTTKGESSPFVWTDEEISDELVRKFAAGCYDNDSGKHIHATMVGLCREVKAELLSV